jgi:pimeloyl-ACP methyl ester carboxylesterase
MASPTLPTLVLVPGAFGATTRYDKLLPQFKEAGLNTVAGAYPNCNPADPASATATEGIKSLHQNVLLPLVEEEGKDVVILAHSYGGVVAGGAAKGVDKATRLNQGYAGRVVGLIYVTGNITLENESLLESGGGTYSPFIKLDKVSSMLRPDCIFYDSCIGWSDSYTSIPLAIQGPGPYLARHVNPLQ